MLYGVETQQQRALSESPSSYTAGAVHFAGGAQANGPTWLAISSMTATNNSLYSFSIWFKGLCTGLNSGAPIFIHDVPGNFSPWISVSNQSGHQGDLRVVFAPTSGGNFSSRVSQSLLTSAAWHHMLFSCNFTTGTPAFDLIVDGSRISYSSVINVGNFYATSASTYPINSTYNGLDFFFMDDSGNDGPDCDIADAWFAPGVSLLSGSTIPSLTIAKFIDVFGRPADPAGFPSSAVLFKGGASTFATNAGTGGAATLHGSLTNASTHP